MSESPRISIAVAAELMQCSRRHARRKLRQWHTKDPRLGLLCRPTGSAEGHMLVSVRALRDLLREPSAQIDDLSERVGYLESDMASIQARTGRLEKSAFPQRICR